MHTTALILQGSSVQVSVYREKAFTLFRKQDFQMLFPNYSYLLLCVLPKAGNILQLLHLLLPPAANLHFRFPFICPTCCFQTAFSWTCILWTCTGLPLITILICSLVLTTQKISQSPAGLQALELLEINLEHQSYICPVTGSNTTEIHLLSPANIPVPQSTLQGQLPFVYSHQQEKAKRVVFTLP